MTAVVNEGTARSFWRRHRVRIGPIALTLPALLALLLFFVAPIAVFFVYSFLTAGFFSVEGPLTLAAYRDALTSLLDDSPLPAWLADPPLPTTVVIAEDDQTVLADGLSALLGPAVDVVRMPGTHGLPLERPAEVARVILLDRNTPVSRAL